MTATRAPHQLADRLDQLVRTPGWPVAQLQSVDEAATALERLAVTSDDAKLAAELRRLHDHAPDNLPTLGIRALSDATPNRMSPPSKRPKLRSQWLH